MQHEYQHFLNIFLDILNKHAPIKKKYIRANQSNFMTRKLSKAIMKRSKLRNRFLKEKSETSRKAYNIQRNYCVNLLRKSKREYFANIKINNIAHNKKFRQTVKPLFSDKINHRETINLIDNEITLSNDEEIAETFNKYFCKIAKNLSLPESPSIKEPSVELCTVPVILALEKHKDHPSITSIKNKMTSMDSPKFSFRFVSLNETLNRVNKLNCKKASQATDIPVKIIKENKDVISFYVFHNFNNALSGCSFPTALKYADVRPAFKKDDKTDKENYRPISILPNLSKVYERLMYDQMCHFFDQIFSKLQCGFRKGFSAEQCLIHMIEKWWTYLDTGGHGSALLADLCKAFDCIDHQLLIAKLNAYGVDTNSLYFLASYLEKRKQRTKVNGSYSNFDDIFRGVPQGSILGPLLFNIY